MGETPRNAIAGALFFLPFLVLIVINIDRLDALERTCKSELLKTERMVGAANLTIDEHFDFWTKTISGGGMFAPWSSPPYQNPKVVLVVEFRRDGTSHKAWVECLYSKLANTGEPPEVSFKEVRFAWENVLKYLSSGTYTWVPWDPSETSWH